MLFKRNQNRNTLHTYSCNCGSNVCWSCETVCGPNQCSCQGAPLDPTYDTAFDNSADNGGTEVVRSKVEESTSVNFYNEGDNDTK